MSSSISSELMLDEVGAKFVQHLLDNKYVEAGTRPSLTTAQLQNIFFQAFKREADRDLGNINGSELIRWMIREKWITVDQSGNITELPRHNLNWPQDKVGGSGVRALTNQEKQRLRSQKKRKNSPLDLVLFRCSTPGGYFSSLPDLVNTVTAVEVVPSVVIVLNTRLPPSSSSPDIFIWPGFGFHRLDKRDGGVLLHHQDRLQVQHLPEFGVGVELPVTWVLVGAMGAVQETVVGTFCSEKEGESRGVVKHLDTAVVTWRERFPGTRLMIVGSLCETVLPALEEVRGRRGLKSWGEGGQEMVILTGEVEDFQLGKVGVGLQAKFANTFCPVCSVGCRSLVELKEHRNTPRHNKNMIFMMYQKTKTELLVSPHRLGLELTLAEAGQGISLGDQGVVEIVSSPGQVKSFKLQLKNCREDDVAEDTDPDKPIGMVLEEVGIPREDEVFQLSDEYGLADSTLGAQSRKKIRLKCRNKYKIDVRASTKQVGHYRVPVIVSFYHETQSPKEQARWIVSHMAVELFLRVQTEEIRSLQPSKPYSQPRRRSDWGRAKETVPGRQAKNDNSEDRLRKDMELGQFFIGSLRSKLIVSDFRDDGEGERGEEMEHERLRCRELLERKLEAENYQERWELLLHCEEKQLEQDIRHYDMEGVSMELGKGNQFKLRVPGLQENRPSVIRGDKIYVRMAGNNDREYEGYVHDVREDSVELGFSQKLVQNFIRNMKFNVRFTIGRFPLRNMHRAVSMSCTPHMQPTLFPSQTYVPPTKNDTNPDIRCYNRLIEQNVEQLTAVRNIVSRTSGLVPYLVFGPPGTGKTVTVVEAIKQVYKLDNSSRIVATAPSNAAADLLAERLYRDKHIPKKHILRLNAMSRTLTRVTDTVKEVSNITKEGFLFYPTLEQLATYRVLVVTLVTAGRLVSANLPSDHFSHVFVDEAGQATEPESLVPLSGLLHPASQVVLVGDPRQLGPVIRSSRGVRHGLNSSLLERLMCLPLYSRVEGRYDQRVITKLVRNFRSHKALLEVPNRLYYDMELQSCGDPVMVDSCLHFPGLTARAKQGKVPLVFHGVVGQDLKEERSPSFFNPEEVVTVLGYVRQLCDMRENKVLPKEIGVITPYRQQVQKIRQMLGQNGFKEVTVGSTEEFQGQERRVVIVSTVRSNPEYVHIDNQYKLGFLTNPKRFNVAITRAKALLVVIGNPHILSQDADWRTLLDYSLDKGCYTGSPYNQETDEDLDRLATKFKNLLLDKSEVSLLTQMEEPAWRSES